MREVTNETPLIAWWSGGIASAVVCHLAIKKYGRDCVKVVFIDTKNEDIDTYRFLRDCEKWYKLPIEVISSTDYDNIHEVWYRNNSLNISKGAVCSDRLKRAVRQKYEKAHPFGGQAFGFDENEKRRALSMSGNYPHINPEYPLIDNKVSKERAIEIVQRAGIKIPNMYLHGFSNNNCFGTGCVQGGIGYWQKIRREYPEKFNDMAKIEHELTERKGSPVTMLTDREGGTKKPLFLKRNPNYPDIKDISQKKGREPTPLLECNGFCGSNDLEERAK